MADYYTLEELEAARDTGWAAKARQQYLTENDPRNREREAVAIVGQLIDRGAQLSTDQQASIIEQFVETGSFDMPAERVAPATTVAKPEVEDPKESVQGLERWITAGKNILESSQLGWITETRNDAAMAADAKIDARQDYAMSPQGIRFGAIPSEAVIAQRTEQLLQEKQEAAVRLPSLQEQVKEQTALVQSLSKQVGNDTALGEVSQAIGSLGGQPETLLPIIAGVAGSAVGTPLVGGAAAAAGAIPMAKDAYEAAYYEARYELGATPEESKQYARIMGAIEFGGEAVGGKLASAATAPVRGLLQRKLKKELQSNIKSQLTSRLAKITLAAGGEGIAEGMTGLAQEGASNVLESTGFFAGEEARENIAQRNAQLAASRWESFADSALAGSIAGGGIATPTVMLTRALEVGQNTADLTNKIVVDYDKQQKSIEAYLAGKANKKIADNLKQQDADNEVTLDIAREEQRIRREEDSRAAFEQKDRDEAARKELEEEAGFQTIERDSALPKDRLIKAPGNLERVPVNPAMEIQPEAIQAQREQEATAEQERLTRVAQGQRIELLRKQRSNLDKKKEKELEKQATGRRAAQVRKQNETARRLVEENPNLSDVELESMLEQELAAPVTQEAAPVVVPEKKAAKPVRKAKKTPTKKQRPELPPITEADRQGDALMEAAANQWGIDLGMASSANDLRDAGKRRRNTEEPATEDTAIEQDIPYKPMSLEEFVPKAKAVAKSLAKRTSQDSRDVQELIRQGKLTVAPNAESIGREEKGRSAEFDEGEGKMYVYLNNLDSPDNAVGIIAGALHEATHAGQFNDRTGRSNIFKHFLGDNKTSEAANKIRKAADNGNKIAQRALTQARADTKARDGDTSVEDLEVVGYFTSEVVKSRGGTLGSLGGVARDITSAARGFIRDNLGVDLKVTLGDLNTAATRVGGEITQTDIKKGRANNSLGMIGGKLAEDFNQAEQRGEVYEGSKDFLKRFEIPDIDAELTIDDSTKDSALRRVLDHKELYTSYPELMNYKVTFEKLGPSSYASFDQRSKTIAVNQDLLNFAVMIPDAPSYRADRPYITNKEFLRNTILHEVQHAVQAIEGFVPGANPGQFIPGEIIDKANMAGDELGEVIKNFDLGRAEQTLSPSARAAWNQELTSSGVVSREAKASLFLGKDYYKDSSDRMVQRYGPKYAEAFENFKDAREDYDIAYKKAYQVYLRDHGETEARNTEYRSRMTAEERRAKSPESTMVEAEGNIPAERTLDTAQYTGGRKPIPASEGRPAASLAMAKNSEEATRRYAPSWFTSLMRNDKGLGKEIRLAWQQAKASPAADEAIANASLGKYESALHDLANERGVSFDELNNQIMNELDGTNKEGNKYSENRATYRAVTDKYGRAGEHLMDLRDQVDSMTQEMIKFYLDSGIVPSEQDKKMMKTLISNMGRYTHRLYAAHQGEAGKVYAREVMKAYKKGKKKGKDALSETQKENYDMVKRAVAVLVDDSLMIPDDKGLSKMGAKKLNRLYKTWKGGQGNPTAEQMKDALAASRDEINSSGDKLQNQAEKVVSELLGLARNVTDPIASYYRGGKLDKGILQERTKIPAEIRALMGEITDPGTRLLATVAKQAEFVSRMKFLLEVKSNANPGDLQSPDATGADIIRDNKMERLEGEAYGPLEGWWASPNMQAMLGDMREVLLSFEQAAAAAGTDPTKLGRVTVNKGLDTWTGVAAKSKQMQIVGNLFYYPLNFVGSWGMLLSNGNMRPDTFLRGGQDAINLIRYARNSSLGLGSADLAVRYGVTDSATVGELKGLPYAKLQGLVKNMAGKKPSAIFSALKTAGLTFTETYAMMDVWAKIANFHNEVAQLRSYYEKNGEVKTDDQLRKEAAEIVNRTNITYSNALPLIKSIERGGITQFATYFYEVFRSQVGNALQGIKEMTTDVAHASTPTAKAAKLERGTKRLAGQAAMWTMFGAMTNYLGNIVFGEDEEEEWAIRSMLPDWHQNQDVVPVGVTQDNEIVLFNMSRIDPIGPITDIMRQAQTGSMSFEQAGQQLIDLYVKPRIAGQIITALGTSAGLDRPTREPVVKELLPEGWYGEGLSWTGEVLDDQTVEAWLNVGETMLLPGTFNAYRESNPKIEGDDFTSNAFSVMRYMGARFTKLDPHKAAKYTNFDYEDVLGNGRKDIAELFEKRENVKSGDLLDITSELIVEERKEWKKLARIHKGMEAIGMNRREINKAMKEAGVAEYLMPSLRKQDFESNMISESSITAFATNEMKGKSRRERKEIEAKWKEAWTMIQKMQGELE